MISNNIPKVIHYCWFGGNPLPPLARKCIESWKKYLPNYEIKEWNESNFNFNSCQYAREAFEQKKWAFVSDYARFKILYENGGLYFDTDVELINSIDDILEKGPFMAIESGVNVAPGLGLAANIGLSLYKTILDIYHSMTFMNEDGSMNQTTIVYYTTEILKQHGLKDSKEIQSVEGINIYPKDYFCPLDYKTGKMHKTKNTRAIHHYTQSWKTGYEKFIYKIKHLMGPKISQYISKLMHGKK
jgi:glycosyltransferase